MRCCLMAPVLLLVEALLVVSIGLVVMAVLVGSFAGEPPHAVSMSAQQAIAAALIRFIFIPMIVGRTTVTL